MMFADVREVLITVLRERVRNGELTERGLARLVGVSQPHIHNVLKGTRAISVELSDQILQSLRLSLLDLIQHERMESHLSGARTRHSEYVYVSLLNGAIGPSSQWPTGVCDEERLPFSFAQVSKIAKPIAARLATDPRMSRLFSAGDIALLDQSELARSALESGAYYVVKSGACGMIRRVEVDPDFLYLIPDDCHDRAIGWQKIALEGRPTMQFIRARAYVVNPVYEWQSR